MTSYVCTVLYLNEWLLLMRLWLVVMMMRGMRGQVNGLRMPRVNRKTLNWGMLLLLLLLRLLLQHLRLLKVLHRHDVVGINHEGGVGVHRGRGHGAGDGREAVLLLGPRGRGQVNVVQVGVGRVEVAQDTVETVEVVEIAEVADAVGVQHVLEVGLEIEHFLQLHVLRRLLLTGGETGGDRGLIRGLLPAAGAALLTVHRVHHN